MTRCCAACPPLRRSAERVDRSLLAVGDDVVVADDGSGHPTILRVAGRRTVLCRQDTHHRHREQIIVANVDTVGIVSSATDPPLRPRLIDRYLVALYRGGPRGLIVVNKVDEASPARRDALAAQLAPYGAAPLSLDVVWVSAETGEGVEALRARLEGQRCAFVGHSGVGKSSLAAALGAAAQAGGLAGHGRGRHTTSTSTLHRLPGCTELIDTPGIRQLGLLGLTVRQLRAAFVDLAAFADGCAYSTCTHAHEAGCAVQAAVDDGLVARARYDSYLGLLGQTAG